MTGARHARKPGRWLVLLSLLVSSYACGPGLPEADTPAARLYASRCGSCHAPYRPGLMTSEMWMVMVDRMEHEMRRRGLRLRPEERAVIIDYLTRNAAGSGRNAHAR